MKQEQLERANSLVSEMKVVERRLTGVDLVISKFEVVDFRLHYNVGSDDDFMELDTSIVEATLQAQRDLIVAKLATLQTEFDSL